MRVVSSVYLRLLLFLTVILIPACESSSPAFHMMYSACKLNKQGDSIQPWHTFPICNQSVVSCLVLTVAFWPAYRFLKRQVWWSVIPVSFKNFPVCCDPHSQGFSTVNETEVDDFLEFLCFFYDPKNFGNLIWIPLPFLHPAWTSGSSRFMYCWSLA